MKDKKRIHPKEKAQLHDRNKHRERYNFKELKKTCPELSGFVIHNKYNDESIDFANPKAVKILNKALLMHYYDIEFWQIPDNYLCPPIPGRADYIHNIADLLRENNYGKIPTGKHVKCLDIGIGANCVYPIIGSKEYGWSFVGSDIDKVAIESAIKIIKSNPTLKDSAECRLQNNPKDFFYGVISKDEFIDVSICNPPYHASAEEVQKETMRKLRNLSKGKPVEPVRNFGGQNSELWCEGGEGRFVRDMIRESRKFADNVFLFSTMISKKTNLKSVYISLEKAEAYDVKMIPMGQGNKISRIVAWTFLDKEKQQAWKNKRWNAQK